MSQNYTKGTFSSKCIEERDIDKNWKIISHQGRLGVRVCLAQERHRLDPNPVLEGGGNGRGGLFWCIVKVLCFIMSLIHKFPPYAGELLDKDVWIIFPLALPSFLLLLFFFSSPFLFFFLCHLLSISWNCQSRLQGVKGSEMNFATWLLVNLVPWLSILQHHSLYL